MPNRSPRVDPPDRPPAVDGGRGPRIRTGAVEARATANRMLAHVRKTSILDTLRDSGSVQVGEIASRLAVSEMTIRRDLLDLEREGQLKRLHGGAVPPPVVAIDRTEPSFDVRMNRERVAKERVAAAALPLVENVRTVALDVGATTFLFAQLLRGKTDLHLFTNSLRIAAALADGAQEIYVPGGRVRGGEMAIGGPAAVEAFGKLWFDIAFVGVSGITAEGLFDYSIDDTEVKRVYLRRSSRKVVLCDSSKFHRQSLVRVADFSAIDTLVTDALPPADIEATLRAAGVALILAKPASATGA